jgi:thioredoxin-related protein
MKKIGFALVLLLGISNGFAQNWKMNFDAAMKEASEQNKKVLLFFSVPERCDNCKKLEQNVFASQTFNDFAKDAYVLLKIDFSYQSDKQSEETMRKNLLIVEKYNKDGFFPYVVILNKDAKVLGQTGVYKNETPQQFVSLLQSFNKA